MKYDESDNVVVRASRAITDRVSQLLGESNLSPFEIGRIGVCGRTVCALFARIPTSPENFVQTGQNISTKTTKTERKNKKSYPNFASLSHTPVIGHIWTPPHQDNFPPYKCWS